MMATPAQAGGTQMGNKGLTIGLVIVSVITTFAAVTFYMGRSAEQAKRLWAESQLEEVLKVKATLEQEKEELTRAKADLETKVQDLEGKVSSLEEQARQLSEEIATERRAAQAAREEMTAAKREASEARGRLEAERREKLTMADDLARAKQDVKRAQDELTQLRQAKEALERRVKEIMGGSAATDTIVVTPPLGTPPLAGAPKGRPSGPVPDGGVTPLAAAEGSVLVVNREFNFVVVNLGERDGVKPGHFLEISRGNKSVAKVQVERVYENMAAANILPEATKEPIKEGDQVRRSS